MIFSRLFTTADRDKPAREISGDDLKRAIEDKACVVVDVREPSEFSRGHIPGAVNLPLSRFSPLELPQGKPVVFVCLSGARSFAALNQALKAGAPDARHYPKGMNGWRAAGGDGVR